MSPDDNLFEIPGDLDPERLYLEEAESISLLSHDTTRAAQVMFDLQQHGALYQYAMQRRQAAKAAIAELISVDPKDSVIIASLQAQARAYVEICDFVEQALIAGRNAEAFIQETYGDDRVTSDAG